MYKLKVIFHIDEMEKWDLVLANAKNFYEGSENAEIAILANSEAVDGYLKETKFEDVLNMLYGWNVKLLACKNALNRCKIKEEDIIPFVEIVPAGVVELVKKQDQGFRYIKP